MNNNSLITEEMRSKIGTETTPIFNDVEKGAIIKFAEAIEDNNPLYNNEELARESIYGGIIAPPTFLRSLKGSTISLESELSLDKRLDGGSSWEYYHPIRAGDKIGVTAKLIDIYEREGRSGRMVFLIREISYTNQLNQLVAIQNSTLIYY